MPSASQATLRLHNYLYSEPAISEAIATFADFATFEIRSEDDHYVVDISNVSTEVEGDVIGEFCNFALANSITRGVE